MGNIPEKQAVESFIEDLYVNYRNIILSVISRYIDELSWQEDVFHDVFVQIIRKADFLVTLPHHKQETYLLLMVRGISIDYLRKSRPNRKSDLPDDTIMDIINTRKKPAAEFDDAERVELFMMLQYIPAQDALLLIGKYCLGLDSEELAQMFGLTSTAIRSRIHRAKKRLLSAWKQEGLTMGDFIDG